MACNCGKRYSQDRTPKGIASAKASYPAMKDVVTVKYIGDAKDTFYGVISGNRYVVLPGAIVDVDKADLETENIARPGLLENGLFVLV